jgi:hypothetical protein
MNLEHVKACKRTMQVMCCRFTGTYVHRKKMEAVQAHGPFYKLVLANADGALRTFGSNTDIRLGATYTNVYGSDADMLYSDFFACSCPLDCLKVLVHNEYVYNKLLLVEVDLAGDVREICPRKWTARTACVRRLASVCVQEGLVALHGLLRGRYQDCDWSQTIWWSQDVTSHQLLGGPMTWYQLGLGQALTLPASDKAPGRSRSRLPSRLQRPR